MKTWNWLWEKEAIACGISWNELEIAWSLQEWSTKKLHSLGFLFFGKGFSLLWNHTCYGLWFFQNFEDKPRNFSGVCTRTFPEPSCLFFSKTDHLYTDRHFVLGAEIYPAQCTSLELLHESPQNKLCYRLHLKYTGFSCFPIICSFAVFLRNRTYTIFDILKEAD